MRGALSIGSLLLAGCCFGVSPVAPPEGPVGSGATTPGAPAARPGPASAFGGVIDPGHLGIGGDAVVTGTVGGLNLRSGPAITGPVFVILPEGSWVHIDGAPVNDYWPVT